MKHPFVQLLVALGLAAVAQAKTLVSGTVVDASTNTPHQLVALSLLAEGRPEAVATAVTDAAGRFSIPDVTAGSYVIAYGKVGQEPQRTLGFVLTEAQNSHDVGRLTLDPSAVLELEKMSVKGRQEAFDNSIDRKVYNVGKDLQSAAGSASDLLQNVPAVQVDIEGNVSLRGSSNVLILIDGKTSTLMGKNRAAALEQMGADGIERIEVITNPSAKYHPDGTAGIINLVTKRKPAAGASGSVRANVGNHDRYNLTLSGTAHWGKLGVFGSAGVRQDDRPRWTSETRSYPDAVSGVATSTHQETQETGRPLSRIVQAGAEYPVSAATTLSGSISYNYRDFTRRATQHYTTTQNGTTTSDYQRTRLDPEYESDFEAGVALAHSFAEDRELKTEIKHSSTGEQEDNFYTNAFRVPVVAQTQERNLIKVRENTTEATADYAQPLGKEGTLETGYSGLFQDSDADFRVSSFDPVGSMWIPDLTRTNRFKYQSAIHAVYGTYARHVGAFGAMGGLRYEDATIDTHQLTTLRDDRANYRKVYPTLHLSYDLPNSQQLQLNYSHRVRRPESDDLNPFPEYQDPFNLRAGNPLLKPEQIHSVEAGWQFKQGETTYLATLYHRYRYDGITEVTRFVDSTTLLTTKENLSVSRSSGVELGAAKRLFEKLLISYSGNIYRNEIDAGNLGFSEPRTATAWDAKANLGWDVSPQTLVQVNANYSAKRLTPQGYRAPTSVVNVGLRHALRDKKTSLLLTVSDLFNSLSERTYLDTPALKTESVRRRSSRIIYVGVVYNFGRASKQAKSDMTFDNAP